MSKRVTIEYEGRTVPADELECQDEKEPWSVYTLEDGTVLKAKQSLVNIYRLVDQFKPDGEPIYVFKLAGMLNIEIPSRLKKRVE